MSEYSADDPRAWYPRADYDERPGCATCETRGPKWCNEHAHLLIAPEPRVASEES